MRKILLFLTIITVSLTSISYCYASHRYTPVVDAVKKIEKSVVNIRTEKIVKKRVSPFSDPFFDEYFGFNRTYKTQSLGSGVIVKRNGVIVTNYHVIEAASKIFVITTDNRQFEAEAVGGDELLDLAVLKLKNNDIFPAARLGTSKDIMLGESVIAMGNPFGLNSSVTTGVVSNTRRILRLDNGFSVFIQTDALINPGNSGGPLINLDGEVIGINSAIYREAQGIGFSIPIDVVHRVLPEIIDYGKIRRGYLGFTMEEVSGDNEAVLIVDTVDEKSHAAAFGIRKGDVIVNMDGLPVSTMSALNYVLRSYPPGSSIDIAVARGNDTFKGKLTLSSFPEKFGLKTLKEKYGIVVTESGKNIVVESSEHPEYIREGDVILAMNSKELAGIDDLDSMLIDNRYEEITLTVLKGNRIYTVRLKP